MKPNRSFIIPLVGANAIAVFLVVWLVKYHQPAEPASLVSAPPASSQNAEAADADRKKPLADRLDGAFLRDLVERILAAKYARANEALLSFKTAEDLKKFIASGGGKGISILGQLDGLNAARIHFDDGAALRNALTESGGALDGVGPNYLVTFPGAPSAEQRAAVNQIPFGNNMLSFLGEPADNGSLGRGVTVAVLDSGVAPDVTLGQGRLRTIDIGMGIMPGTGQDDGHGTAVAGLAAGQSPDAKGVAPAAGILSVKVTGADGTSDLFTMAQGIIAASNAGAQIINISMGGYGTADVLDKAIDYALSRGSLIVAAAGNDQAAQLAWPAADPRVISVGAVDAAGQQVLFSNSGSQLSLAAPGYGLQTAWLDNQRVYFDGTSGSAPIVAGAIAAVMSQTPGMTALQAAAVVEKYASDAGAPGHDADYGNGIVNLSWALNRNDPSYADTAIAAHSYDPVKNEMTFLVQNRGNQAVAGASLQVDYANTQNAIAIPVLDSGATYEAKLPLSGSLVSTTVSFTTRLLNPAGLVDRIPGNNIGISVLSPAVKK